MRLIGFEVEEYGPFEAQFVPLNKGIHILAGLNNLGKTSLLRALTPFASAQSRLPYVRQDGVSRISLICQFETAQEFANISVPGPSPFIKDANEAWMRISFRTNPFVFDGADVLRADGAVAPRMRPANSGTAMDINQIDSMGNPVNDSRNGQPARDINEISRHFPVVLHLSKYAFVPSLRVGSAQVAVTANTSIPFDGSNLASFLLTLQTNRTDEFDLLNETFCGVFPYLKRVNSQVVNNNAEIRVTYQSGGTVVPLSACGAGVEQLLILLTGIMFSDEEAIIGIDEPHLYLHPVAERELIAFLRNYPKKTLLLATHSSIMINSVRPDQITHIVQGGTSFFQRRLIANEDSTSNLLSALGYQNSDLLFNNRLLFVEGQSEVGILPKLLLASGVSEKCVTWVGMPQLEGAIQSRTQMTW